MTDEEVVWDVLHNPSAPAEALVMAAAEEERRAGARWFIHRHLVAHHPNTPVALRDKLLKAGACDRPGTCYTKLAFARHV